VREGLTSGNRHRLWHGARLTAGLGAHMRGEGPESPAGGRSGVSLGERMAAHGAPLATARAYGESKGLPGRDAWPPPGSLLGVA